jgi:hypothetical protein
VGRTGEDFMKYQAPIAATAPPPSKSMLRLLCSASLPTGPPPPGIVAYEERPKVRVCSETEV